MATWPVVKALSPHFTKITLINLNKTLFNNFYLFQCAKTVWSIVCVGFRHDAMNPMQKFPELTLTIEVPASNAQRLVQERSSFQMRIVNYERAMDDGLLLIFAFKHGIISWKQHRGRIGYLRRQIYINYVQR